MLLMDRRDAYLSKAAELSELAKNAPYAALKAEFEGLARAYLYLADQAERNSHLDIAYETPPIKDGNLQPLTAGS